MSGYDLTPVERTKLVLLISDKKSVVDLVEHYKEVFEAYRKMGKRSKENVFIIKKDSYSPKPSKVISRLAEDITDVDSELYKIVKHRGLKEYIDLTFIEICTLFAKNALTDNPVIPEVIE